MMKASRYIRYPIYAREQTLVERIAIRVKTIPMVCNICGSVTRAIITADNFRENCLCKKCHSFNRQRQVAYVLLNAINNKQVTCLRDLSSIPSLSVYNTETGGVLHNYLSRVQGYVCSDYFGSTHASGDYINGKLHQDLMDLSFLDDQFDYVISTDVFEHIPDPNIAHSEIHRVLKSGGRHIFTVPFYQTEFLNEKRVSIGKDGRLIHKKEPIYHIDPLREEGILVYNIFSIELLADLSRIGFRTNMYHLYNPIYGILGPNALVFEAIKT
jgi:SAM-dependent methyltransferase